MVDDIPRSLLFILLLLLAGGFFSGAETAISFCNSIRIRLMAEDGDSRAKHAVVLLEQFDRAIVTFLVAINIIHVVLASMTTMLAISLLGWKGSAVATAATTLLVFIFGETLPKNIAKANSDAYVLRFSAVFLLLIRLFTPVTSILTGIGELAKKLLRLNDGSDNYTEEEFISMLDNVEKDGLIDETEKELIKSSIVFKDIQVENIMTPREKITAINGNTTSDALKEFLICHPFSRYPVYYEDLDHTVGVIRADQCLLCLSRGDPFFLPEFISPLLELPSNITLAGAFEAMVHKRTLFSLLRSPDGKVLGILTMDDILRELTGDWEGSEQARSASAGEGGAR